MPHKIQIKKPESLPSRAASNYTGAFAVSLPAVQRKMKILATGNVVDNLVDATHAANHDCTPLRNPVTSPEQYTVKTVAALSELAQGNQEQVLLPYKHVIGEVHTASEFDRIKGEWPGIPAMGEGSYTVSENQLGLPAQRGSSHATFEQSFQSQGSANLPLENFHAAALARLTGFLIIWNEYEQDTSDLNLQDHIKRRADDMVNLFNSYLNVSAGVVIRGSEDMTWYHFSPNYKGDIEKKYAKMFEAIRTKDATDARGLLDAIKDAVDRHQPIPAINSGQFNKVRALINAVIPLIGEILNTSRKGLAQATALSAGIAGHAGYIKTNSATLRGTDMQTALDRINPVRELLMKEQIDKLAKPGLVKVGRAHIPGLRGLNIAGARLYNDAADFDHDLNKRAQDL